MNHDEKIAPRVDLIARIICSAVGFVLGACSFYAFSSNGLGILSWLLRLGAAVALFAGIFGPRSLRIGLVTWMPWF